MRRTFSLALILALAATWIASALAGPAARAVVAQPAGDPEVIETLSGISYVPPRAALDSVLGPQPTEALISIARAGDPIDDPGVRIRAYRALAEYPGEDAEEALIEAVSVHGGGSAPLDNLYVRAAMEALAQVAGAGGVDPITPMLMHSSRDVRAAAARALADCGSPAAVPVLRARLNIEPEEQVKAAISQAIRRLDGT